MSIVYEALQKTQLEDDMQATLSSQDHMTSDDWIDVSISLVIAFLLAAIIVVHYPQFNIKSESVSIIEKSPIKNSLPAVSSMQNVTILDVPDDTVKPTIESANLHGAVKRLAQSQFFPVAPFDEAEYKLKHTLNGVFVSDDEKVAMVNNRFFNMGDSIDGMKIVSIEPDKIKLQNENGMMELRITV